jgi:hypothetical protein
MGDNRDDDDRSFRFPTKIFARSIAVCCGEPGLAFAAFNIAAVHRN